MDSPAGRTRERWRRLTQELDRLRQPVVVIGNWRTGPGTVLHINPAWIEISGLTASETLGHPATNFLFSPDRNREAYRRIRRTVAGGETASAELLRVRKGSRPAEVRLRAWAIKLARDTQDYLIVAEIPDAETAADLARRTGTAGKLLSFERPNGGNGRAENLRLAEELIGAQQRFQHSLETCAFGVERIDTTGRILYANPIYHDLLGYAENELIGENIYQRLLDPVQARSHENYIRHIVAMEPPVTPLFTSYRRKDGAPIHLRLDWDYDRSVSGVTIGLISIVTPVAGWPTGDEPEPKRPAATAKAAEPEPEPGTAERPDSGDDFSRARLLQQTLHAARVWASILAHHHPEGEDAQIVSKVDNAIDDALRLLGADRRPTIPAASYYEETAPLQHLVVAVVEPVSILRASLTDLLRSWGCNPVGVDEPAETIATLERNGRVPDMMIVNLDAAIGIGQDSVVREVWRRYGAGIPCAIVADRAAPEIEKFAESVGMKIIRPPVHPIELRSTMLALRRAAPARKR